MDKDLLVSVCCGSFGWYVDAENLVKMARLVELELAAVEDDYEGPRAKPTKAGINLCIAAGLIERDLEMGGYMRVQRVSQT
jgi:hypothetical protein